MTRGHTVSKAAFLLARRIGGRKRDEWLRAMAGEWDALEHGKAWWALGCLGAAVRDRLWRERGLIPALVGSVIAVFVCNNWAMNALAPTLRAGHAPTALWLVAYLSNSLPLLFALGWLFPARARVIALAPALLFVVAPALASVLLLGIAPGDWIDAALRLFGGWLVLYPAAFVAWSIAARLGARLRLRRA